MLNYSIKAATVVAVLALTSTGAWAQSSTGANTPETKIGVTPQDAKEAAAKAVPRSDTGTLVRTAPSASERATDLAKDAKDSVTPGTRATTNVQPGAASSVGKKTNGEMTK